MVGKKKKKEKKRNYKPLHLTTKRNENKQIKIEWLMIQSTVLMKVLTIIFLRSPPTRQVHLTENFEITAINHLNEEII